MRITQFRKASFQVNLFVSTKCAVAIPMRSLLERDVLIQASLDPFVRMIDFVSSAKVEGQQVKVDTIVLHRDGNRYAVEIDNFRPPRSIEEEALVLGALSNLGIRPLPLSPADILDEPRHSSAREVWHHHQAYVPFDDRTNVMAAIEEHGALSINDLSNLINVRKPMKSIVCALACEASVEIDLSKPLGGKTTVRASPTGRSNIRELLSWKLA